MRGGLYLQSLMAAVVTFSTFWTWLFLYILVGQASSRELLEGLGAALFYSLAALTAVMLQGFWTIKRRPRWWSPAWRQSLRLSTSQILWVGTALFLAVWAVGDRATSRLFLGSWLMLLYGCFVAANRYLPAKIIEMVH